MAPDDDKTRTHATLTSGTMVSHYRIIEKIGAGGMGEVYLAEDTALDRKVALKFLPLHLCQDPECRARFAREAQAAAKLDHPNIVSVFEVGELQGRPFFSMQIVEGQSLKEVIAGKALPLDRILELAIQICEGLQAAHENGITHRDIKPSNILIDSHGRARIVDFGLASVLGSDQLTKTGSTLGTIGHMSPEQVRGDKVDHRTDLFSFGVVLYEMVTGHAPFKLDSEAATLNAITNTNPELLARFRREVPTELQTIVDKALEKNITTRYQHADDIVADLKRLSAPTGTMPVVRPDRRRTVVLSLIVVAAAMAVFFLKPWRIVSKPSEDVVVATNCVAVLPFSNLTGDVSLDALGRMVADWATQGLSEAMIAEVVSQEAIARVDVKKGVPSIAKETGATLIVSGSYYRVGDSIQFQTRIVNADEKLLLSMEPTYTSTATVMEGVEFIRQLVLGGVAILLDKRSQGKPLPARAPRFDSYKEYIRGNDAHFESDWATAALHFRRAYELDTMYLTALLSAVAAFRNGAKYFHQDSVLQYLELRRDRLTMSQQLQIDIDRAELSGDVLGALEMERKRAGLMPSSWNNYHVGWRAVNANRPREGIGALEFVDPTVGSMRDWTPYWDYLCRAHHLIGEHAKELSAIRTARGMHPTDIRLAVIEIRALAAEGKMEEIRTLIEEASTFSEMVGYHLGWMMFEAGSELRFHGYEDAAMNWFAQSISWYRAQPVEKQETFRWDFVYALYFARQWEEARLTLEPLAKASPDDRQILSWLGVIAARQGNRDFALRTAQRLADSRPLYRRGAHSYARACIVALLGNKDEAVSLLREAFVRGENFSQDTHVDFDLESLWNYPPYLELMKPRG